MTDPVHLLPAYSSVESAKSNDLVAAHTVHYMYCTRKSLYATVVQNEIKINILYRTAPVILS